MNKQRRAELDEIKTIIAGAKDKLESVRNDEQDSFDNMPESLQGSERGQVSEAAIETLDNALEDLDEVIEYITEAIG